LPGIGSGIVLDELQWMALDTYHQGANNLEGYAAGVDIRLRNLNKSLVRDGKPIAHGEEMINELHTRLEPFVSTTLPMLKRLGGVK
jgi:hypothetical protein